MLKRTGLLLLLVLGQVIAQRATVQFIEDAKEEDSKSASRIVSGWPALPGQLPHQVSIRMVSRIGDVTSCGGSVVHRNWVITAAHCTAQQMTLVIRAGLVSLTKPEYIDETLSWFNHPGYNDNDPARVQPHDVAIVRLNTPVTYSPLIKAIKIQPSAESYKDYSRTNEIFYASGFGRTWTGGTSSEVLNWVYLRATSYLECAMWFGTSIVTQETICAEQYNVTSQSTCQGDSGGPLVHAGSDGIPTLVGITSFVAGTPYGCHSGVPAGFVRPGPYLSWLHEVTGIDFENIEEEEITTEPPTTTTAIPTTTTEKPVLTTTEQEPSTTEQQPSTTERPTSQVPEVTEAPDSTEESSSESEEDKELADLLKRLEVEVKVKVKMDKLKKKTHVHEVIQK